MQDEQIEIFLILSIIFYSVLFLLLFITPTKKKFATIWKLLFIKSILHIILFWETILHLSQGVGSLLISFGGLIFNFIQQSAVCFFFTYLGKNMTEQTIPIILFIEICFNIEIVRKFKDSPRGKILNIIYCATAFMIVLLNFLVEDAFFYFYMISILDHIIIGIITIIFVCKDKITKLSGNMTVFKLCFVGQYLMYNLFLIFWIVYYAKPTVNFINFWFSCFAMIFNCIGAFLQYWLLMHYCIEIGEKDEKVEQLLKEDDEKENSPQLELEDVSSKYKQI